MSTYIALLRGINVGGKNVIKMAALRAHFEAWGARNVRTYMQCGNVVFTHRDAKSAALQVSLQKHLAAALGYAAPTLLKAAKELAAIARANPFPATLPKLGSHMYVCFFERAPNASAIAAIQPHLSADERLLIKGDAGYAYYANGLGRAKLSSTVIERKLGMATLRNWNTVSALLELASR
jgi:uncharacterized protein (DUF1697 family)